MWQLENIKARNICAFEELDYNIGQKHTTLIFGNNMDNDSQPSNGSGKSALIEAISIGLTGEVLRDIKSVEEIINDSADEAEIILTLMDEERVFTIERHLYRKSAQTIKLTMNKTIKKGEGKVYDIPCASVADYNKEVLNIIGLTKDEIFSNIILSKHKYKPFLSSSDKDKKEIINRFSNGIVVDEAIEELQKDIEPIQTELSEAQRLVTEKNGQVTVLAEQIEELKQNSVTSQKNKEAKIADNKNQISDKRALIRKNEETIGDLNKQYDNVHSIDEYCQGLENDEDIDVSKAYKNIAKKFDGYNKNCGEDYKLSFDNDYPELVKQYQNQLKEINKQISETSKLLKTEEASLQKAQTNHLKLKKKCDRFLELYNTKSENIQKKLNTIKQKIQSLENECKDLRKQKSDLEKDVSVLETKLAGVIECPHCHYEFTLADDVDIEETRKELQDRKGEIQDIGNTIDDNNAALEEYDADKKKQRQSCEELVNEKSQLSTELLSSQSSVNGLSTHISNIQTELNQLQNNLSQTEGKIANMRNKMFDEVFDLIDDTKNSIDNTIKNLDLEIVNAQSTIDALEDANKDLENVSETDVLKTLEDKKEKCQKEYDEAVANQSEVEGRLNKLKQLEAYYVEFKTHLANTKIEALGHITNEFLEAIDSDIRIQFSGFTVLKSGKIRDKIFVSLLRDGVDCGSFGKFSEGEKTRVSLASILAMHKLTNLNCDPGKGLDLLVLDEILEACDEGGLTNTFEALNQLEITSLVVSHGNIAEGYPYRTIVNKQNGVSYINE